MCEKEYDFNKFFPVSNDNLCRVFEMPERYPAGFCAPGGTHVGIKMMDWFEAWPRDQFGHSDQTKNWSDVAAMLEKFILKKDYVKVGRTYLAVTVFGTAIVITKEEPAIDINQTLELKDADGVN